MIKALLSSAQVLAQTLEVPAQYVVYVILFSDRLTGRRSTR
jgi:hypothetical protein